MLRFVLLLSFLFIALAAPAIHLMAQDNTVDKSVDNPVRKIVNSHASFCAVLPTHVPEDGVTYRSGVNVHGKSVAPADLNAGPTINVPEYIDIPLSLDVARLLRDGDVPDKELDPDEDPVDLKPSDVVDMQGTIGTVRVYNDGRVSYNGRDISKQAYAACHDAEEDSGQE